MEFLSGTENWPVPTSQMAWQSRSSPANDAQQQETHTLLDTANGISSETQKAFDAACYPAVAPAEAQQQQLRGVNQQISHAQPAANGMIDQVSDGRQDASLRHFRHLIRYRVCTNPRLLTPRITAFVNGVQHATAASCSCAFQYNLTKYITYSSCSPEGLHIQAYHQAH